MSDTTNVGADALNVNGLAPSDGTDAASLASGLAAYIAAERRNERERERRGREELRRKEMLSHGSNVEIARIVAGGLEGVIFDEDHLWRYKDGVWAAIPETEIYREIASFDGETYNGGSPVRLSDERIESITRTLCKTKARPGFFEGRVIGICMVDGLVTFDPADNFEPRLQPHDPEHRKRHMLPGHWQPGTSGTPPEGSLLARYLHGIFLGDPEAEMKLRLLRQIAGVTALGYGARLLKPKAVVLLGRSADNGKSQFLDMLMGLLPPSAVTMIPPDQLHDDNKLIDLVGALLNVSGELSGAIASERFKEVITAGPLQARKAYARDLAKFRAEAQHVYAANRLPMFRGGMDKGVRRRLLVLEFHRSIPVSEQIENIGQRIAREEPDLLLAWAIEGAADILRERQFSEPPSSKQALAEWTQTADDVAAWIADCVLPPLEVVGEQPPRVKSGEAYRHFRTWFENENEQPSKLGQRTFTERLREAGLPGVRYIDGVHGFRGWEGLRLKGVPGHVTDEELQAFRSRRA
jgi:hypothetical protein